MQHCSYLKEAKKTEIDENFISLVTYRAKFGAAGL